MPSRPELRLAWCSHAAAKFAVERWHYSHVMPKSKRNLLGVWEDERFIGAVVFGTGAGQVTNGARYGLPARWALVELMRVALAPDHQTPVSRIVAIAVRLLARHSPKLRAVISYADPHQGHHGGIYQAGGWIYTGTSAPTRVFIDASGRAWHQATVLNARSKHRNKWGMRYRCKSDMQRSEARPGKHRYLLPLDAEAAALIRRFAQPYPKRGRSAENGTPVPTGGGGVIPTRPLHPAEV